MYDPKPAFCNLGTPLQSQLAIHIRRLNDPRPSECAPLRVLRHNNANTALCQNAAVKEPSRKSPCTVFLQHLDAAQKRWPSSYPVLR